MTTTQSPETPTPDPSHHTTSLPPGKFGLPLVGETFEFFRDNKFAQKRHQRYGNVFKSQILGSRTIFLRGPDANQFVLTHENQYFQVKWPPSTRALLGSLSLALQTGGTHQSRRKLLAQAFMPRALSSYITAMAEITDRYTQQWAQQKTLVWYPELRHYTLDVACKLFVGLDHGAETPLGKAFETWCGGLFSLPINLPWTQFGRAERARRQLLQQVEQIIQGRLAQTDPGTDALGLLIQAEDENGDRLTVAELKDQVLLLLFAGHETLTSAIATFCLQMAQHPEIMAKVRAEQAQWSDAPLTLDALKQMTYLDQVLREVLRLTPPVGGGFREVLQTCEFNGYRLPKGWSVIYQIASTHDDRTLYADPDRFDPDRFSPEGSSDRSKYSYIPFGGGIRECIGKEFARLEMKIFAAYLARHYQWSLLPNQDLTLITVPTPHPTDGLRVHFQPWVE